MASKNRVVGVYIDITGGTSLADTRVSLVESLSDGTLIVRHPDDAEGMRLILNHIEATELLCLIEALHKPRLRKIA